MFEMTFPHMTKISLQITADDCRCPWAHACFRLARTSSQRRHSSETLSRLLAPHQRRPWVGSSRSRGLQTNFTKPTKSTSISMQCYRLICAINRTELQTQAFDLWTVLTLLCLPLKCFYFPFSFFLHLNSFLMNIIGGVAVNQKKLSHFRSTIPPVWEHNTLLSCLH